MGLGLLVGFEEDGPYPTAVFGGEVKDAALLDVGWGGFWGFQGLGGEVGLEGFLELGVEVLVETLAGFGRGLECIDTFFKEGFCGGGFAEEGGFHVHEGTEVVANKAVWVAIEEVT